MASVTAMVSAAAVMWMRTGMVCVITVAAGLQLLPGTVTTGIIPAVIMADTIEDKNIL
mgnify:CR=1 FL=1